MKQVKKLFRALPVLILLASCGTGSPEGTESEYAELTSELTSGTGGSTESCAFTQGYWKNHPEAWPVSSLTLGSVSYTKVQLLVILHQPVTGNGLISLAHQLIAAKLNVANGADDSYIKIAITAADALIGELQCPPGGSGYLSPSQTSDLVGKLDEFNNTGECKPAPVCGDGKVETGEECDDGNQTDNDTCSNACKLCPPVCGNGKVETGEECDDGNQVDNDTCSNACTICPSICGNGILQAGEECDDGNQVDNDTCSNACTSCPSICGNGILQAGEECDDGNQVDNDTCSNSCKINACVCP